MTARASRVHVVSRQGAAPVAIVLVAVALGAAIGMGVRPLIVVGILTMAAAFVIAARRLEALVAAAVLALFLPSLHLARGATWALALRWVLDGTLLAALGARVAVRGIVRRAGAPVPVSLITFTGFALVTAVWSVAPRLTAGRAVTFVTMIAILALVHSIDDASRQVANALRLVGAVVAFGGLTTARFGAAISGRYAGLFINPNAQGVASALLFPFALERAFKSRVRWVRLVNGLTAALLVGEAAAAASRGGMLAVTVAYLFLGWSRFRQAGRRKRVAVLLLPATLALAASLSVFDAHRLSSVNTRASLWNLFPRIFWQRPILGHGFGTTELVLRSFSPITRAVATSGVDFHNSYLNLLSDLGIVGGVLIGVLVVRAFGRRRLAQPEMAAVILAGLVSALFESWLLSVGSGFSFVFWFALISVASGRRARAPDPTPVAQTSSFTP